MKMKRAPAAGFTLIELMAVVAIVAILAAIALPSYQESVIKSRRNSAAACTLGAAQYLERFYTTNLTYAGAPSPALPCMTTELAAYYTFAIASTATGYTVSAIPTAAQPDGKCGTLTLNQLGVKSKSGTAPSVTDCW